MVLVHKFPNGLELHEPPYTPKEEAELARLMNRPPVQMTSLRHVAERKSEKTPPEDQ